MVSFRRFERAHLPVKIDKAEFLAEGARVVVRFVVARQHPEAVAERLKDFAAAIEALAEGGEVARGDIEIGGLRDQIFQRAQVAVNVAEDQDLHGASFTGAVGCCSSRCRISRPGIPSVSQPWLITLPALSNTTR